MGTINQNNSKKVMSIVKGCMLNHPDTVVRKNIIIIMFHLYCPVKTSD